MNLKTATWQDLGYQFHLTDDGSPTLIVVDSLTTDQHASDVREKMHSWEGAFSETVHLYEPALRKALTRSTAHLASVGLGLGYVEILFVCLAEQCGQVVSSCESFEKNPLLIQIFATYFTDETSLSSELKKPYDLVLERYAAHFSLDIKSIKVIFRRWLADKKIIFQAAVDEKTVFERPPTCFVWDAYGRRFNGALWADSCLQNALVQATGEHCVFASYASFGSLKKVLAERGFVNSKVRGFGKKKESSIFFRPEIF